MHGLWSDTHIQNRTSFNESYLDKPCSQILCIFSGSHIIAHMLPVTCLVRGGPLGAGRGGGLWFFFLGKPFLHFQNQNKKVSPLWAYILMCGKNKPFLHHPLNKLENTCIFLKI